MSQDSELIDPDSHQKPDRPSASSLPRDGPAESTASTRRVLAVRTERAVFILMASNRLLWVSTGHGNYIQSSSQSSKTPSQRQGCGT